MVRYKSTPNFFGGAKTWKPYVRNHSNFIITFPIISICAGDFFKVLLKLEMVATDQLKFVGGRKHFFLNFNITLLATCGCASDFLKDATKIQNGHQKSTPKKFVRAKTLKLNGRNYLNFTTTFPTIWTCAGDFLRFCWNSKWSPRINFIFLRSRKP